MIELLEGVPGSGKSYYAVSERFLSWVRANRKIYIYVDGIYLDRLAAFEGRALQELQQQIMVWTTPEDVRAGLLQVDHGAAVILDEAQTIFRSREKVDPALLRMLETHRHKGIDVVMMCQQHGQMTLGVVRLVEVTTKFRRLDRFGFKGRYQAQVRGNPEEIEVIRMFTGKYSPALYAYYSSYADAAVRESARGGSIVKSPSVILGLVGLCGAVAWFSTGHWLTPSADVLARQKQSGVMSSERVPAPPSLPTRSTVSSPSPEIHPVRIQGGIETLVNGHTQWLYVSESGQILTDDEIASKSGGVVHARMERGIRVLSGSGVIWGGADPKDAGSMVSTSFPGSPLSRKGTEERVSVVEAQPVPAGSPGVDVIATPPGIIATPKGILATPPAIN